VNINELRASRNDHYLAAEKLIKAARASSKDLVGADLEQYETHISEIRRIDALMDRSESVSAGGERIISMPGEPLKMRPGQKFTPVPFGAGAQAIVPTDAWTDPRTGQPVCVLTPQQRMSDLAEPSAYDDGPLSLAKYVRGIVTGRWNNAERELRAMNEGTLGSGGYLVPSPLSSAIIDRVRNNAVMIRAGAKTVPMDSQTLSIARVAAANGDPTAAWHAENAAITASDMAFEAVKFTAQTLACLVTASVEVLEDAAGLDTVVADAMGRVLALELDRACLLGSGTAPEPRGIRNQSNVVIDSTTFTTNGSAISASAPTGAVAWDWLSKQVSGLWGVNESPTAVIYNARTAGELDLLRASTGEVLPPPGSVANLQRLVTNSIPSNLTQGSNSDCSEAFVGDFSQALVGMRRELVFEVSRTASVGSTSMFSTMGVAMRIYLRADFQVARPGAFRVVTGIR
jgi:HK97 family phage major capsid protein